MQQRNVELNMKIKLNDHKLHRHHHVIISGRRRV
jgi:hypothetical protein